MNQGRLTDRGKAHALGLEKSREVTADLHDRLAGAAPPEAAPIPSSLSLNTAVTEFERILGSIRRHGWQIGAATLVGLVLSFAIVHSMKDRYAATTLLIMDQRVSRLLGTDGGASVGGGSSPDSEVEILKSGTIAERVVERLDLRTAPDFAERPPGLVSRLGAQIGDAWQSIRTSVGWPVTSSGDEQLDEAAGQRGTPTGVTVRMLQRAITVRRRGLTDVVAIEATADNPERAAQLANAYADAYIEEQVTAKVRSIERAEETLTRRLAELSEALKKSEAQLTMRQLYQDTLTRMKAVAQQRTVVTADARVAAEARPPDQPSFPPRDVLTLLGALIAFLLATALAYARDHYSRIIRTETDIEAISGVRNIGVVPAGRHRRRLHDEIVDNPFSPFSEAIRRSFLGLELMTSSGERRKTVLFTSSASGDGKTTVSVALARAAAGSGLRTVIVDCDLLRPKLHECIGIEKGPGLADLMAAKGRQTITALLKPDPRSSCMVISAGEGSRITSARLFQSMKFAALLTELERRFDFVVLDAPPVGPMAGILSLMNSVDTVLFVARGNATKAHDARLALREVFRAHPANVLTIINHSERWVGYGYSYK